MNTPATPAAAPVASNAPAPAAPSTPAPAASTPAPSSAPSGGSNNAPASAPTKLGDIAAAAADKALGKDTPAQPTDAAAQPAKVAEPPRTFKVKVDGVDREMTEDQVLKYASLYGGAEHKFQQAAEMRRASEQLIDLLKSDPLSVLTHESLGINFRQLAEQYLAKEIQREMLPPEQRELMELREWRAQQEQAAKQQQTSAAEQARQAQLSQMQQQAAREYDKQIGEALMASDLPRGADTLRRVAETMHNALTNGYEIDVPTAVQLVRDRYTNEMQAFIGKLEPAAAAKLLGEEFINKLRRWDLDRIKALKAGQAAPAAQSPQANQAPRQQSQPAKKFMSPHEWREAVLREAEK